MPALLLAMAPVQTGAVPPPVATPAPVAAEAPAAEQKAPALPAQAARVLVLYAHGDLDPSVARAFVDLAPDGIVLAGVGDGNASEEVLAVLSEAAASGVTIVRASRTGSGRVIRNVEIDDDGRGFLVANYLSPQKARILLMLALTQTRDRAVLQRCFMLD